MTQYIFRAQSLDNTSEDPMEVDGHQLGGEATEIRKKSTTRIADVKIKGDLCYDRNGVRLTERALTFVIEVPSLELDTLGRRAPIVCFCSFDAADIDAIINSAPRKIEKFAAKINRSISTEHSQIMQDALEALKKKLSKRRLYRSVLIAIAFFVFLVLGAHFLLAR